MKKKTIAMAIAIALAMAAQAQDYDYPWLAFQTTDGTVKTVAVETLTLTFVNGQLVATNDAGNVAFALTDLSKMFFSKEPTRIADTPLDSEGDEAEVFTVAGVAVGRFASADAARAALKPGLYVIKSKEGTYKMSVK